MLRMIVSEARSGGAVAAALDLLGQDQVDPVAREDEAGDAAGRGHGDRDGAHARAERRGEEAALAGTHQRALGDRLAGGDLVADDGADQALRIDAAFLAADEIGVLDQALRPGLVAEGLGVDDRADGQGARRDQDLGPGRNDRAGLRLRRGGAGEHVLGHEGGDAGDDECADQQHDFLDVHGDCRLPLAGLRKFQALLISQTG